MVRTSANNQIDLATVGEHHIYTGDNLDVLRNYVPDELAHLVYIDPPFNTASDRVARRPDNGERRLFTDRFGSVHDYLSWIQPRVEECTRVLRPGGALFVHCDWRTSHYLKVMIDQLLGYENFVNEIVWKRHNGHSDSAQGSRHFGRNADSILFYGKGARTVWHPQRMPYEKAYIERVYKYRDEPTGRRYALTDLSAPGGPDNRNPVFPFMGFKRAWRYSMQQMTNLYDQGRLVITSPGAIPRRKRYLDEMKGRDVQTIWDDIPRLGSVERVGYPTQKPLALMERIIGCGTDPGHIVLDPFCGSGTTLVAAARMGRRSIGIDQSHAATDLTLQRLTEHRRPAGPQDVPPSRSD